MASRRGQTLVLFALTMLLIVLMVMMTIGLGMRAKRKLELQTVAETAAYSNAVATARAYNTSSLLNRAMVSEWVAMAGVHGLVAWASEVKSIYGAFAANAREMEAGNPGAISSGTCSQSDLNVLGKPRWYDCPEYYDPPGPGACTAGTWSIKDASYEWWHAGLALWNPRGAAKAGDNVNQNCKMGNCTTPRGWMPIGWGELDARAGRQAQQIHASIAGLALIQKHTFRELEDVLDGARITRQLVNLAEGRPLDGALPKQVKLRGKVGKEQEAWREAGEKGAANLTDDAHERVMAEAVLGTRGKQFLVWHRELPRRVQRNLAEIQANLDANWPGVWRFSVTPSVISTYPTRNAPRREIVPWRDGVTGDLGWDSFVGHAWPDPVDDQGRGYQVTVRYRPPRGCGGGMKTLRSGTNAYLISNSRGMSHHQWGHGTEMSSHARWPMKRLADDTMHRDGDTITTCHPFHVHYDERDDAAVHQLDALRGGIRRGGSVLPGIGFVFPRSKKSDGAGGAWGQPSIPVMLSWSEDPKRPDPWDLTVNFRFGEGGGTEVDLGERDDMEDMVVLANGMAYYHRRGAWGEAPNMLNPFWRATLVPLAVDARADDPTPGRKKRSEVPRMLRASKFGQAADAFELLENQFEGLK